MFAPHVLRHKTYSKNERKTEKERFFQMNVGNFVRHGFVAISILALPLIPAKVLAHGYVTKPESRGYACKLKKNNECGAIVYEPQSIEGPNNFPQAGPADGQIANAGNALFKELNEQSATRWAKTNISTGVNEFTWHHTARHATKTWRYFITKQGWNQSAGLTRSSFDTKPFCTVEGNLKQPETEVTHQCSVPADRSGYHVILAVWDIGDTTNSFYNAIDVQIGSNGSTTTTQKPTTTTIPAQTTPAVTQTPATKPTVTPAPVTTTKPTTSTPAATPTTKPTPTTTTAPVSKPAATSTSAYQYVYPNNIKEYKAGTKVLGSDGKVYQCKQFPYSGWCTVNAPQYTPATGSNWQDAWIKTN